MASTEREKRKKPEKATHKAVGELRDILQGKKKASDAYQVFFFKFVHILCFYVYAFAFKVVDASVYTELNEEEYEDRKRRRQKFVVEDDGTLFSFP